MNTDMSLTPSHFIYQTMATWVMFFFGFGLNLLILITIVRYRRLRTPFLLVICSISITDILLSFLSPGFWYLSTIGFKQWHFPPILCNIFWGSYLTLLNSKALHVISFMFLRYIYVSISKYTTLSKTRVQISLCVLWMFSAASSFVPSFLLFGLQSESPTSYYLHDLPVCSCQSSRLWHFAAYVRFSSLFLAAQLLLVIILLLLVYCKIRKNSTEFRHLKCAKEREIQSQKKKRIFVHLLLIVTSIVVCYSPLIVYSFWMSLKLEEDTSEHHRMKYWTGVVQFFVLRIGECVNPVIHFVASKDLRNCFAKLISCDKSKTNTIYHKGKRSIAK